MLFDTVLALALSGCGQSPPQTTDTITVVAAETNEPPSARIATVPDRSPIVRASVIESPLPAGEPIVRDCFGWGDREARRSGGVPAKPTAALPTAKPSTRAKPRSSPPPPPASPTVPMGGGGAFDIGGATGSAPIPDAAAVPASDPASPVGSFADAENGVGHGSGRGEATLGNEQRGPTLPKTKKSDRQDADKASPERTSAAKPTEGAQEPADDLGRAPPAEEKEEMDETLSREAAKRKAVQNWGETVWLSNDDSMSLASAQRALYALSRGVALAPSEIRPHELLNYFSFDTVAPADGQTFGVLGSAEQEGETLTVALAVRGANPARQPLDLTVLLDRSCSMSAEDRMGYTKRGLTKLNDNLQRGDRIDVVLFDSGVCTPLENYVVGRDDPSLLSNVIAQLQPTSSTDLDAGLREAYRVQTSRDRGDRHGRSQRVLLVTDAELNSGNVNEHIVSEVGRQLDEHDIHLSGIGVGREFNDRMLDLLTEKGKGAYVYLGSEAVVDRIFGSGFDSLVRTVAHDVQFALDLPDSLAMTKFYGEEASTNKADIDPIHYHAGTTQLFLQDLAIRDGRIVRDDPIVMRIEYRDAITMEPATQELRTTVGALLDADPHNLHKGRALMAFSDWMMASAMGMNACGSPLDAYRQRGSLLADDAEIAFVNGLVGARCGVPLQTIAVAAPSGVELKVKVDSDVPIAEVALDCSGRTHIESLSGSDTIARFRAVTPGHCTVKLDGNLPMSASVEVPQTGGDLRCMVRGGRISCS